MIRKFKGMGLALFALLAMSAFASTASAQFESEAEHTILSVGSSGMQKFAPSAGGATVECETINIDNATISSPSKTTTTVTVEPTYNNCLPFLGIAATSVHTNGCDYVFHLADNATSGSVDVECPTATGIQITVGSICTYEIDSQTGLNTVNYSNTGSGTTREVNLNPNVGGITSQRTTNHFFCPAAGNTGTYSGTSTVTGRSAGGSHVGVFVD